MNQVIQTVLAAFSNQNIEINTARKLANLKKLDPLHLWVEKEDIVIKTECGKIPLRLYFSSEETKRQKEEISSAIFFIHGGGWSTESVETYDRICSMLSKSVDKTVISVEYRLAPEYPFPAGLEDCYLAARHCIRGKSFQRLSRDRFLLWETAPEEIWRRRCVCWQETAENFQFISKFWSTRQ